MFTNETLCELSRTNYLNRSSLLPLGEPEGALKTIEREDLDDGRTRRHVVLDLLCAAAMCTRRGLTPTYLSISRGEHYNIVSVSKIRYEENIEISSLLTNYAVLSCLKGLWRGDKFPSDVADLCRYILDCNPQPSYVSSELGHAAYEEIPALSEVITEHSSTKRPTKKSSYEERKICCEICVRAFSHLSIKVLFFAMDLVFRNPCEHMCLWAPLFAAYLSCESPISIENYKSIVSEYSSEGSEIDASELILKSASPFINECLMSCCSTDKQIRETCVSILLSREGDRLYEEKSRGGFSKESFPSTSLKIGDVLDS